MYLGVGALTVLSVWSQSVAVSVALVTRRANRKGKEMFCGKFLAACKVHHRAHPSDHRKKSSTSTNVTK
jgi:hypothetical protein